MRDLTGLLITTPMIEQLHDTIRHWIWCGYTGGVVDGGARQGKSKAIKMLPDLITDRNGDKITVIKISYGKRDQQTIRGALYKIARKLKLHVTRNTTGDELFNEIVRYLADEAMKNRNRKVILIVDEAQELLIDQLSVFSELLNILDEDEDVRLSVFFIVNKDRFKGMAEALLEEENTPIRERFFNYLYPFYGIRNAEELASCLAFYDKPHDSISPDKSIVHYLCPQAEASNYQLTSIAKPLWHFWSEHYGEPFGYESWGMTYFIRTINIVLMDYFPQFWQDDDDTINDILLKSLKAAGNEPTLKSFRS